MPWKAPLRERRCRPWGQFQLAVAPVFLLTAIATLVATLNVRLGRIVDRRRALLERPIENHGDETITELALLSRRARLVYLAIFSAVLGALFICLVVSHSTHVNR